MKRPSQTEITQILVDLKARGVGREDTTRQLLQVVYDELRSMAAGFLRGERADHTLQPTALVHEAYVRLVGQNRMEWRGRAHFLAVAAQAMRRILVDHARRRAATKRGGDWQRITLDENLETPHGPEVELLDLDHAITKLACENERASRVVELKFFAAMTGAEIAHVLGVSSRTVKADWASARVWLARELQPPSA